MKVAIVIGHNKRHRGAYASKPIDKFEFDFNRQVYDKMIELSLDNNDTQIEFKKFERRYRNSYTKEIKEVYRELTNWEADISIELHFNSFKKQTANGTETLSSGSKHSLLLSNITQKHMVKNLKLKDRGIRILHSGNRGYGSVTSAPMPSILVEPFFGSNKKDLDRIDEIGIEPLAKSYIDSCVEYSKTHHIKEEEKTDTFLTDISIKTKGLTKQEFYIQNKNAILNVIDAVNDDIEENHHGEIVSKLSFLEVISVMHCEMGIKSGKVNPNFEHSNGEIGLFPLPSNIKYWNGANAPLPNIKISVERNLKEYILYLGNIKNKYVGRNFYNGEFYKDLFDMQEYQNNAKIQSYLLCAVVHGWYYLGNYENKNLPYSILTEKIIHANSEPIALITLLEELGYVHTRHGNSSIIVNRLNNISQAHEIVHQLEND